MATLAIASLAITASTTTNSTEITTLAMVLLSMNLKKKNFSITRTQNTKKKREPMMIIVYILHITCDKKIMLQRQQEYLFINKLLKIHYMLQFIELIITFDPPVHFEQFNYQNSHLNEIILTSSKLLNPITGSQNRSTFV